MNKSSRNLALLLGLFLFSATSYSQSGLVGRVTSITGTVEVLRANGDREILQRRDTIRAGDEVRTNANSLIQLRFVDSAILLLGCSSRVSVHSYRYDQEAANQVELILHAGNLRSIVGEVVAENYLLRMANTVTYVSGGDFGVAIASDDIQYFGVYDGFVKIVSSQAESRLGVGADADFGRLQPGYQFEELSQQPQILSQSVLNVTDCTI